MTRYREGVTNGRILPRKRLGKTGVEVTTVGIGTARIGTSNSAEDTMDRQMDEDAAVATLHAALEHLREAAMATADGPVGKRPRIAGATVGAAQAGRA